MEEAQIVLDRQSFEALAADTRVKILKLLVKRRKTLSELSTELKMSVSGVKEHLETLEKAGLIEKIDDGHKWKYYELTEKGAAIVAPKASMRIMLLLSLSIVAFMASAFMMLSPPMTETLPMAAVMPEPGLQKTGETLGGVGAADYSEETYEPVMEEADGTQISDADYTQMPADDGDATAIEAPIAARETNALESALWEEEAEVQHNSNTMAPKDPEVPLPLVIAMLSLGTMLVCFYELSKKR